MTFRRHSNSPREMHRFVYNYGVAFASRDRFLLSVTLVNVATDDGLVISMFLRLRNRRDNSSRASSRFMCSNFEIARVNKIYAMLIYVKYPRYVRKLSNYWIMSWAVCRLICFVIKYIRYLYIDWWKISSAFVVKSAMNDCVISFLYKSLLSGCPWEWNVYLNLLRVLEMQQYSYFNSW